MQATPDDHWPLPTTELKPALDLALALTRADMGVLMLVAPLGVVFRQRRRRRAG